MSYGTRYPTTNNDPSRGPRAGLYTQPVPTEKIPGYWVFFGYWVYLFRTYLVNFCMGKYLIPKYPVVPTFWVLCRIEILRDFETYGDSFGLL